MVSGPFSGMIQSTTRIRVVSVDVRQFFARLAKADFADAVGVAVSDNHVSVAHLRKRLNNVEVLDFRTRELDAPPEGVWPLIADFVRDFAGAPLRQYEVVP